ncbi:GEVED domain-containing protein [Flavobacterium sp. RNTU_13]|uniref:Ig-like domain-containing protein n=1 Tax=Flavobacterium sp. RNTU_13 TaxID=3375145 RepID=UPI0039883CCA
MRKITLLIALILLGITGSYAQASLYGFSVSTDTYVPITGGTVVTSTVNRATSLDSYVSSQLTLPAAFEFAGNSYTSYSITSNGHVSLGTPVTSAFNYTPLTSSAGGNIIMSPFAADLYAGATGTSEIRTELVGDEIVFQWTNFARYFVVESINFQVRLNTVTKSVKFVYDGTPLFTSDTTYQPQIGIKSAVGVYKVLSSASNGTFAAPTVVTTGATSSSLMTLSATNTFATGLTYTFTAPPACAGTPNGGAISGELVRFVCSGSTPAAITAPVVNNTTGIAFQWQQSFDGSDWTDVTAGTGAATLSFTPEAFQGSTIMYRLKSICTASGDVAYSSNFVTVNPIEAPLSQASAIALTPGLNSLKVDWTNGSGVRRMVFVSTDPIEDPIATGNFPAFSTSTVFANDGQQLVYDGTASTVTITGLNCTTPYYVKVYEYNRCGSGPYDIYVNLTEGTNAAMGTPVGPATATLPATNNFAGFTGANLSTVIPGWYEASRTTASGTVPVNTSPVAGTSAWTNSSLSSVTTAKINLYTTTRNEWIISPKITLTGDSRLKFKAAITDFAGITPDPTGMQGTDDAVTIFVSTDGCGLTWVPLYEFNASNTTTLTNSLVDFVLPLTAYTGQTVQIAFRGTDGPADDAPDYDFHIANVVVELQPTCDSPLSVSATANGFTSATINWNVADGSEPAQGFDYYYNNIGLAPNETTVPAGSVATGVHTASISGLTANTTYYVWVRSVCAADNKSAWVVLSTPLYTGYCTPAPSSVDDRGIINVTMGDINNTTVAEQGNYGNYTNLSTSAVAGATVNFNITYATGYTYGTKIWIDWNNDADFNDQGELVYTGVSGSANPFTLNGSFTIPASAAVVGTHTVRIGGTDDETVSDPCYTGSYGTFEDYTLVVTMPDAPAITSFTPAAACAVSSVLTVTGTGLLNATLKVGDTTITPTSVTDTQIVATIPAGTTGLVSATTFVGTAVSATEFTVTAPAALAISAGQATICAGQSTTAVTITDGASAYDTFVWTPATGVSGSAETGFIFNPSQTTSYTLTASQSAGLCTISVPFTVNVNALPAPLVITPASQAVCQGQSQALIATGGDNTGVITLGTGTTAPGTTSYPNPFSGYYGGVKTQILFTAAELQAQGLVPGVPITSLSFDFFASSAIACNDFRIKIGETTQTNLTSGFLPSTGLTTVYNANYTPVAGTTGWVPFTLTSQYVWNGGNLVVEVAHNAGNFGNGSGTRTKTTTTTENTVYYGAKDSVTPAGMASYDALTSYSSFGTSTSRPNMRFNYSATYPVIWSPVTDLYTDAAATTPYTGGDARTVYFKGNSAQTYTASSTNTNGCSVTGTTSVTVSIVDAPVAAATQTFCQGAAIAQLVAEGTNIQWYAAATGGQALSPNAALTTGTYYATQTVNGCQSLNRTAVAVTITVVTAPQTQDVVACNSYVLPALTTGAYYTASAGQGALVEAGTVITQTTTLFVYVQSGDCFAENMFTVNINTTSAPTAAADQTFCQGGVVGQLSAEGTNIKWYASATSTEALGADVALVNGNMYYATQTVNGCESAQRTVVTAVINTTSAPTATADQSFCQSGVVGQLSAEGTDVKWYASATSTDVLGADASLVNGNVYYATQTINGCESGQRAAVTVTIVTVEAPAVTNVSSCDSYVLPALEGVVYRTSGQGTGDVLPAGTVITSTTNLYAVAQSGSCIAETPFTVTITASPVINAVSPQVVSTQNDFATIADIVITTDANVTWYATEADALAGTNPLFADSVIAASTTYYAKASSDLCFTIVPVTVSEILGDKSFDMANFAYYPNPVNSELTISYSSEITTVEVFNLLGQHVLTVKPNATVAKVNMSALAEGAYVVKVAAGSAIKTVKVIKK